MSEDGLAESWARVTLTHWQWAGTIAVEEIWSLARSSVPEPRLIWRHVTNPGRIAP
jgi:hypothetical protein